ncbi:MAG: glutamate-5-semialdehyde dehydrogenase [Saccharofermentans sp.]|jgi:glutamate-5-semialdehyde dehydrogenase|nr:glutamate-5-semialdehyde dehydrogenase [Mageeibacillus sp.]MCI1263641.1 glutamate-5-semialdehyde dehydrogenase [Saccharofermentans sp.]MCI1274734.1 glutamate-5-semialdehyde dehydrogenase [Saccharofermentans sp.]MCI1769348.1 glutamate-5-semialdehyde dehydrogenase [Mageeibacillus sp.]MCI2043653.1 glutamate-5-semialdehyde dehydrogenase [Mageeibacillus sp.]
MSELLNAAARAKTASFAMAALSEQTKNSALEAIAEALNERSAKIFDENKKDLDAAMKAELDGPLIKRLRFGAQKLAETTAEISSLISIEDPVGKVSLHTTLDEGLELYRVSCPIGVIGVIFESRPDALIQIASLCLKSGNAVFLKGGSEALNTNRILADIIYEAGLNSGLPAGWLNLLTSREEISEMLKLDEYIDLIIPRGSNSFVQYIMKNTSIAVLGHADGVCHTYINEHADRQKAIKVVLDAKTQYVSVCNATETILVDECLRESLLPELIEALRGAGVMINGDKYVAEAFNTDEVTEWHHEYLDMKVSVKLVSGIDEAIEHINRYGSGHTDAIITEDKAACEKFMIAVDSGSVLLNCSTRFADGFRYGFGAEVGVSTSKIHARGPVGLEGLLSYKYRLYGNGDIVADYADGSRTFKHEHHKLQ